VTRLSRRGDGWGPAAPVRLVHLGPGAFFRAHPAWYTELAGDGWGIAAVTPRSDDLVGVLGAQDGLYTVLVRAPDVDSALVVGSISAVVSGRDPTWTELLARPEVGAVTLTVTEAGYRPDSPTLAALLDGLDRRRQAGAGPLTLVSCDNLSGNGRVLADLLLGLAQRRRPDLAAFVEAQCSFPDTVVDRITPAARPEDLAAVERLTGFRDDAAVVTEPFSEWVLEDRFPAGRPAWETAGARFVDDVRPFQDRKLRLLNAGHSLLAYLGGPRGHAFVHQAVADPTVHGELLALWAEARRYLGPAAGVGAGEYCEVVEGRWSNARLPHSLAQIGADGSLKLRQRLVPTVLAARDAGVVPGAAARVLGAWIAHLRGHGSLPFHDRQADQLAGVHDSPLDVAVRLALEVIDARFADDRELRTEVTSAARSFEGGTGN
jgi:fructuronate reductase